MLLEGSAEIEGKLDLRILLCRKGRRGGSRSPDIRRFESGITVATSPRKSAARASSSREREREREREKERETPVSFSIRAIGIAGVATPVEWSGEVGVA